MNNRDLSSFVSNSLRELLSYESISHADLGSSLEDFLAQLSPIPLEQKQQAQILYLLQHFLQTQNRQVSPYQDKFQKLNAELLSNFQAAQDLRCQQVLFLLSKVYNLLLLLQQIKLIDFSETSFEDREISSVGITECQEMIDLAHTQIIAKLSVRTPKSETQLKSQIKESDIIKASAEQGLMRIKNEQLNQMQNRVAQLQVKKFDIPDEVIPKPQVQKTLVYEEEEKLSSFKQPTEIIKRQQYDPKPEIKHLRYEETFDLDLKVDNYQKFIESKSETLLNEIGSQNPQSEKYLEMPEFPSSMKPINFYMLRNSIKRRREDVLAQISRDLNAFVQETYTLHIYNSSKKDVVVGQVHVSSKVWPKYVSFLKGIKERRVGQVEHYSCNKENSLKCPESYKQISVYSNITKEPGPFICINL
uniref:Uncharacterized protein n=1 Tax=Sterkiella nova TaxID=200597 RepID=Q9U4D5_STENO|nr:unknown protein [Sterkiella nova]